MKWQPVRIVAAMASLTASFYALDQYEKRRAVSPPSGWASTFGTPLSPEVSNPAIGSSAWRIGPQTRWTADSQSTQLYVRPELSGALGLSLAATEGAGTWIWARPDGPVTAVREGELLLCMGSISAPTAVAPFAIAEQEGSIQVTWGEQRMVCPANLREDRNHGGLPSIQTTDSQARLRSIGRNKQTDGVPLSPLWWMSGLMVGGLMGMLALDLLLSILARIRPARVRSEE